MARFGALLSRGWLLALFFFLSCDGGTRGSGIGTGFSTLTGSLAEDQFASALVAAGAAAAPANIVVQVREAPSVRAEVDSLTHTFTLSNVPPGDVTLDFIGETTSSLVLYGLPDDVSLYMVKVRFENGVAKPAGFAITPDEGSGASVETTQRKGAAPLEVAFNVSDVSVPMPPQVLWSFGDGTRSGSQSTSHRYNVPGNYVVEAEISGDNQRQRAFQVIQVSAPDERILEVTAHADVDRGPKPLRVNFTAAASNARPPVTFLWDFGDGTEIAEGDSVTHVFTEEGLFFVQVTAFDDSGSESSDVVQVQVRRTDTEPEPLSVSLSAQPTSGTAPLAVALAADIKPPTAISIVWTFDDQTPPVSGVGRLTHTFFNARATPYFVTVTVTELSTGDTVSAQAEVTVR